MEQAVDGAVASGLVIIGEAGDLQQLRSAYPEARIVVLVSDLFSPNGYADGLNTLLGKGNEVGIVHLLSPDEIEPPLAGDLRLVDIETGAAQEVTIDGGMRQLYIERVQAWREGIRADCVKRGVHYLPIETDYSWEKVILSDLRKLGVVK